MVRGPSPAPMVRHRNNRHLAGGQVVTVPDEPFAGGPKLPAKMPDGEPWPAATKTWWSSVSSMPHSVLWAPSDWQFAVDTALVHARWVKRGVTSIAAELRHRERLMGTTADARRALRIEYGSAESEDAASEEAVLLADARRRLRGGG